MHLNGGLKVDMMAGTKTGTQVDMMAGTMTETQCRHDIGRKDEGHKVEMMAVIKTGDTR